MSFLNDFPHVRQYDGDLGWLIRRVIELSVSLENFVNINTIKYANPISWNITTQYEANTVVIDPADGTAYISTRPVPSGVLVTNDAYWTPIFNYGESIADLKANIEANYEDGQNATRPYSAGDMVWIKNKLYIVNSDLAAGTLFINGVNVSEKTVIDYINDHIAELNTAISRLKIRAFDNVAAMVESDITTDFYAITCGYYFPGDLGSCLYRIVTSPEGSYYIRLSNGLYAELIPGDSVNICQFGGVSGRAADFAPIFFTMFDYCIERSISRAFVPAGSYPVFKAVAVPPGVELIGDGYSTYIYEGTGNTLGATLTCASRSKIKNMRVGHLENNVPVVIGTPHSSGIGIGRFTYDAVKNDTYDSFYSRVEDVEISDIYCTDNYVLQCEFTEGSLNRLTVKNIYAENAVVRLTPQQTARFTNIAYKNIYCDALVLGVGGSNLSNARFSDIECNYLRYYIGTVSSVVFERLHVKSSGGSTFGPANNMAVSAFIQNEAIFRDCHFENNANLNYGIQIYNGETTWINCVCDGFNSYNIFNNRSQIMHCYGCDFGDSTQSYMYGEGYATISNPQGGIVGGANYIDDYTEFRTNINPKSPAAGVSSLLPSYLQRIGKVVKFFALWMGTVTDGDIIATLPYSSWIPKTAQKVYAYGYTPGSTYTVPIALNIGTDGNITITGLYPSAGAASAKFDRIAIDVTYLL